MLATAVTARRSGELGAGSTEQEFSLFTSAPNSLLCSARGKEARIRAAGADFEADSFSALRAVAFVGGSVAVDVDARVDVAALELDADEFPFVGAVRGRTTVVGAAAREV